MPRRETDRIRVLRLIARMNVGGPALQVTALTEDLDPTRFDQLLLIGDVGPDEADYLQLNGIDLEFERVTGLGRSPRPGMDLKALAQVTRRIRDFRPDVVHTHTAKAGVIGRVAANLAARLGTPAATVHTFHGHLLSGYFNPTVTRAVVDVERGLAKRTDRLVSVGARVRDQLLGAGIGSRDQYAVVPPGVIDPHYPTREKACAELGVDPATVNVAFVARLTEVKRPDRLVEVAKLACASQPNLRFIVAGDGTLLDEMKRISEPLSERFSFVGFRPDVATVYAASDLALLTSDNEGMPVSLIEASMAGIPSVSTPVGSVGEVIQNGVTGFVTATRSVADLSDAVVRLGGDENLRSSMGAAARSRAQRNFSRARLVSDMAAIYRDLVG